MRRSLAAVKMINQKEIAPRHRKVIALKTNFLDRAITCRYFFFFFLQPHVSLPKYRQVIAAITAIIRLSPPAFGAQLVMSVYTKAPLITADKLSWLSRDHDALRTHTHTPKKKKIHWRLSNDCLCSFTSDQGDTDISILWDRLLASWRNLFLNAAVFLRIF